MMIYVSDSPMWRNIRYLRRKKGISLEKLAEMTWIPYNTLYRMENRTLLDIDHDDLLILCHVLGVTVEELVEKDWEL